MKKVINGKLYDTSTAELVGEWNNGRLDNRLYVCAECLYRKRTGEFFLFGSGGPGSKYAKPIGNNDWSGDDIIIPLSSGAAAKWAEEHLSGEEYEKIFGEIVEDDTKRTITLSVGAGSHEKAKRAAAERGISLSALVDEYFGTL